jgi:hypothetical protein
MANIPTADCHLATTHRQAEAYQREVEIGQPRPAEKNHQAGKSATEDF